MSYRGDEGYPWNRLGYTYNWKRGAGEVGVAEFVIRYGAKATTPGVASTADYCSGQ